MILHIVLFVLALLSLPLSPPQPHLLALHEPKCRQKKAQRSGYDSMLQIIHVHVDVLSTKPIFFPIPIPILHQPLNPFYPFQTPDPRCRDGRHAYNSSITRNAGATCFHVGARWRRRDRRSPRCPESDMCVASLRPIRHRHQSPVGLRPFALPNMPCPSFFSSPTFLPLLLRFLCLSLATCICRYLKIG